MIDGGSGGLGGVRILGALLPFPRQELTQTGLRDFGDAREDVGEPGFRVDIIEADLRWRCRFDAVSDPIQRENQFRQHLARGDPPAASVRWNEIQSGKRPSAVKESGVRQPEPR